MPSGSGHANSEGNTQGGDTHIPVSTGTPPTNVRPPQREGSLVYALGVAQWCPECPLGGIDPHPRAKTPQVPPACVNLLDMPQVLAQCHPLGMSLPPPPPSPTKGSGHWTNSAPCSLLYPANPQCATRLPDRTNGGALVQHRPSACHDASRRAGHRRTAARHPPHQPCPDPDSRVARS